MLLRNKAKICAALLLAAATSSSASIGSFIPCPIDTRTYGWSKIKVKLVDTQNVQAECLKASGQPLTLLAAGCAVWNNNVPEATVVFPLDAGPQTIVQLMALSTPDAALGHEIRHVFDGSFHGMITPFIGDNQCPNPISQ